MGAPLQPMDSTTLRANISLNGSCNPLPACHQEGHLDGPLQPNWSSNQQPQFFSTADWHSNDSGLFDTSSERCYDSSMEQAISFDSFDFDILTEDPTAGASNPVSTSSPLSHADLGATSFHRQASTENMGANLLQSSLLHEPLEEPRHPAVNRARSVQTKMMQLELNPFSSILITHTNSCTNSSDADVTLPKRRRPVSYRTLHAFGVVSEPVALPSSRELCGGGLEENQRSCKRQAKETTVGMCMYVCNYCKRHKPSASKGQDGRVRIRCECGGRHRDGTSRMHAQWSAAPPDINY